MKLTYRDIAGFLARPNPQTAVIVVYGPESGLVQERGTLLLSKLLPDVKDPLAVVTMDSDTLAKDPMTFLDEANSVSLLGPARRVIKISPAEDDCTAALKDYAANPNPDVTIIALAGNLSPRSSLRVWAEKDPKAVALPCYVENAQELQGFITDTLRQEGIAVDSRTAAFLSTNLVGDRMIARRQLEKLVTYKGPQPSALTMDDVVEAIPDLSLQTLDDIVYAAFSAKWTALYKALDVLFGENTSFMLVLRSLQNHARRLELVHEKMSTGQNFDDVVKSIHPPLFYKLVPQFRQQLNQWSPARLQILQADMLELESDLKTYSGDLSNTLLGQWLLTHMSLVEAA